MTYEEFQKELKKRIKQLCPKDDILFRCMAKNKNFIQELLRIITGIATLEVIEVISQADMKLAGGYKSAIFDVLCIDSDNKRYNIEIQNNPTEADIKRARFNSSMLDLHSITEGQTYKDLPETEVIFITDNDFFGKGEPVYTIMSFNKTTGEFVNDGRFILFVNGKYRNDDIIGKLMHDFSCANPTDMKLEFMQKTAQSIKETTQGVNEMSSAIQDLIDIGVNIGINANKEKWIQYGIGQGKEQGIEQTTEKIAINMLLTGKYAIDAIAEISGLSIEKIKELEKQCNIENAG